MLSNDISAGQAMITMCPRSESHLTYMSSVTFTTEFHGGQVLSGHQLADDFRRRVHELGQSLRVGVLGRRHSRSKTSR